MAPASSTGLCDAAVLEGLRHISNDHGECREADHPGAQDLLECFVAALKVGGGELDIPRLVGLNGGLLRLDGVRRIHVFEPPCTDLLVAEEDVPLGSHKSRPGLRKRRGVVRVRVLQDCAAGPVELLGEVLHLSIERD